MSLKGYLRLEFFKRLGFETKEDGMQFIDEQDKLKNNLEEKVHEIDEMKRGVLNEMSEMFRSFEKEKYSFLKNAKEKRLANKEAKKEMKKNDIKNEMKEEILKEIEEERRRVELENNAKYCPELGDISADELKDMFLKVLKTDCDKKKLEKMKGDVEKGYKMIEKVMGLLKEMA